MMMMMMVISHHVLVLRVDPSSNFDEEVTDLPSFQLGQFHRSNHRIPSADDLSRLVQQVHVFYCIYCIPVLHTYDSDVVD